MCCVKKKLLKKLKSVIVITLLVYLITSVYSVISILQQGEITSFPWYTGIILGLGYLIPILSMELIVSFIAKKSFKEGEIKDDDSEKQV